MPLVYDFKKGRTIKKRRRKRKDETVKGKQQELIEQMNHYTTSS